MGRLFFLLIFIAATATATTATTTTTTTYRFEPPGPRDYKIGLLVNPCQYSSDKQSCCMDTYGTPEYVKAPIFPPEPPYRVIPSFTLGGAGDFFDQTGLSNASYNSSNTSNRKRQQLVDEDGRQMDLHFMRRADDEIVVDQACKGLHDPFPYCTGRRRRQAAFHLKPACMDNNQTVDAMQECWDPMGGNGTYIAHCMQVAYSQTAYPIVCGNAYKDDPRCGTFLEIHLPKVSDSIEYDAEYLIAERRIVAASLSGYVTTTIPLSFTRKQGTTIARSSRKKVQKRRRQLLDQQQQPQPQQLPAQYKYLLCNYLQEEPSQQPQQAAKQEIAVGASVLIKDTAPTCCCPTSFRWCPYHDEEDVNNSGPLAGAEQGKRQHMASSSWLSACPLIPPRVDWVMCGKTFSPRFNNVTIYNRCPLLPPQDQEDERICPYFPECKLAVAVAAAAGCQQQEETPFSFVGRVGTVKEILHHPEGPQHSSSYLVTFNNGRTTYLFEEDQLQLEKPPHNYELWWVERTPQEGGMVWVRKKKGFRVTSPRCTFDVTNGRFLPYAILQVYPEEQRSELIETLYR